MGEYQNIYSCTECKKSMYFLCDLLKSYFTKAHMHGHQNDIHVPEDEIKTGVNTYEKVTLDSHVNTVIWLYMIYSWESISLFRDNVDYSMIKELKTLRFYFINLKWVF